MEANNTAKCRAELSSFIERLESEYRPWYEKAASRQFIYWHACSLTALLAGFASSIVAAFMKEIDFAGNGRLLLTILPVLGALASALLSQFRFQELEDLRERGRIELEDIILWARGQLSIIEDDKKCLEIFDELRNRVKDLESTQHRFANDILKRRQQAKQKK